MERFAMLNFRNFQFSEVLQKFIWEYKSLSLIILNNKNFWPRQYKFINVYHPDFALAGWNPVLYPMKCSFLDTQFTTKIILTDTTESLLLVVISYLQWTGEIQFTDYSSLITCSVYHLSSTSDSYLEDLSIQLNQIYLDYPSSALCIVAISNYQIRSNTSIFGHSYSLKTHWHSSKFLAWHCAHSDG